MWMRRSAPGWDGRSPISSRPRERSLTPQAGYLGGRRDHISISTSLRGIQELLPLAIQAEVHFVYMLESHPPSITVTEGVALAAPLLSYL